MRRDRRLPSKRDAGLEFDGVSATVDLPLLELRSDSGETFPVEDPCHRRAISPTCRGWARPRRRRALEAAAEALPAWRGCSRRERGADPPRWARPMMDNQEALARLLTLEQGKPLAESRAEIAYAASFLEWFGEEGKRVYGDTIPTYMHDRRIVVTKEPVGVTAGITPWNFPAAMVTRKAAPALAAGCTMVLKPAEQTPLSALAVAQLGDRGRAPRRRARDRHRRRRGRAGDRARADREPARPQARLHRLDRGREAADGAVRRPA